MYKDDYISAFGKLTPSEAWKAETLEKMRALEKQQREQRQLEQRQKEGRAGFGSAHTSASAGVPDSTPASAFAAAPVSASGSASGSAPAAAGRVRAKKPVPLAVHLRRAALPIAAVAMLAILPMTTMRGCGASNSSMALSMEDRASNGSAPAAAEARDTAGGAENGTAAQTPAATPSGGEDLYDGVTEEADLEADSAQSMAPAEPAPLPGADWGLVTGDANKDTLERKKFDITYGGRPFRVLDASEITFATVGLTPPDTTLEIPDVEKLTGLLQDVVVYSRDDSYTEYCGQGVTFTLTFADGTQTQIMAYNPFVVIDGAGYRTEYAPCEALSQYANDLLSSGGAVTVLAQPPALAVIGTLDETYHDALLGGYSWQSKNADGTFTDTEADSAHPLACKAQLSPALEMTYDHTLNLLFPEGAMPDEIVRVRCWSDASWGKTADGGETVRVQGSADGGGYAIPLKPGGYIYEVTARWDTADGYGGTASYAFYVKGIA